MQYKPVLTHLRANTGVYMTYNLILGDCLEKMNDIPDKSVDLLLTDPPYLKAYSTGHRKGVKRSSTEILNDRVFDFNYFFNECNRITKDNSHIYVFGCWQTNAYFLSCIQPFFKIKNNIIWVKNNWTAGDLFWSYGQSYENIIFAMKGRKRLNGRRDRDVLFYDRVAGKEQLHLNQKPIELIEYLIKKSSEEGDVVCDPFMGSGTTGVACINTNRNFIGIEKDEKYFNIAEKRIKEHYKLYNAQAEFGFNKEKEKM